MKFLIIEERENSMSYNVFSEKVIGEMVKHFDKAKFRIEKVNNGCVSCYFESPKESQTEGVLIMTDDQNDIWIRFSQDNAYSIIDDLKELIPILKDIFLDKIVFSLLYNGENWIETSLEKIPLGCKRFDKSFSEEIISWSGKRYLRKING